MNKTIPNKPKVLVLHPIIAPYRIDFFNAISEKFDTRVCLMWDNLKDQKFDYKKIEQQFNFVPTYILRDELGFFKWSTMIWKTISDFKPDIVITNEFGFTTDIALLCRLFTRQHYKIVSIIDDSYDMVANNNQFTWRHKKAMELLMPYLDNVINVEPRVTEWYKGRFGKGIYFPIICNDEIARRRQERVLNISEKYLSKFDLVGKRVLLFVGRLVKLKNLDSAIQAFVKANVKDSVFIIVGDGVERSHLESIASDNKNILFVGRYEGDDLYAWYNVGQVFTLPSIQEPFGAVTNEALVAGCKALVSRYAGSNCLVEEGINGKIIDPYDIESFAKEIRSILQDIEPLNLPLTVKPNLMQSSFGEHIDRLSAKLLSLQ